MINIRRLFTILLQLILQAWLGSASFAQTSARGAAEQYCILWCGVAWTSDLPLGQFEQHLRKQQKSELFFKDGLLQISTRRTERGIAFKDGGSFDIDTTINWIYQVEIKNLAYPTIVSDFTLNNRDLKDSRRVVITCIIPQCVSVTRTVTKNVSGSDDASGLRVTGRPETGTRHETETSISLATGSVERATKLAHALDDAIKLSGGSYRAIPAQ